MWTLGQLTKPMGVVIIIFWFLSGCLFIYLAPQQNLGKILGTVLILDKWIFLGLLIVLAFLIFSAVTAAIYRRISLSYELEESAIKTVKGVYKKEESYIPYKSIESIDIRISSAERFWGLASLLIFTSGVGDSNNPASAEGYIEGLKYDDAVSLKDELLRRMK